MPAVSIHPKGASFVRYVMALASAKGDVHGATDIAAARWDQKTALFAKEAAVGMVGDGGSWGGQLSTFEGESRAFFDAVAERTVLGRLRFIRRVPLLTRLVWSTSGAAAAWVQEGEPAPVSRIDLADTGLEPRKAQAIIVATREMVERDDGAAEGFIRGELMRALVEALDLALLDPANAGDAATPVAITNGAPTVTATADPDADLKALVAAFAGDLSFSYFAMHPDLAVALHSADRPEIGARGGELFGVPVLTSRTSPAGQIALVDPTALALGEDEIRVRAGTQGVVEVSDTPDGTGPIVSLWQAGLVALSVGRIVNWRMTRPGSVAVIAGAAY